MRALRIWMLAAMIILVGLPEPVRASIPDENSYWGKEENSSVGLDSSASDAVQNSAYANLQIVGDTAHVKAGFTHPGNLPVDVQIEWGLYGWDAGAVDRVLITAYNKISGNGSVVLDTLFQDTRLQDYDYYLLETKNKVWAEGQGYVFELSCESRWSRIAPYNGTQERTGEVTSYSAVLHTYLTEKPAFAATEGETLLVPPMAGFARFSVYSDAALLNKVSDSGFYPVDDYVLIGTAWRRTFYNFRWTVTGLEPGTTYYYVVETKSSDGLQLRQATNINSFTTAPLADANQPVSFVVAHCFDPYHTAYPDDIQYAGRGLKIFASMLSDSPPDFIILQGDTVFYDGGDPSAPRDPINPVELYSPNVGTYKDSPYLFRWLYWPAHYQFTNFMNFFQQVPGYWQVDDHDYWVNNINEYQPDGWDIFRNANPTPGEYGTVGEDAANYYNDNPYLTSTGDGNQYWRSIRWGQHLEIFLEEGRNLRDYDAGLIWGVEQREWLEQRIRQSTATFKVVAATTPLIGPIVPDDTYPYIIPDKHVSDYFRPETELFLTNIADVENVYLIGGDRHYKYHSVVNAANFPELSHFHEFGSGAGAGPPHAALGGEPDSDLAVKVYSDADVGASAGYLRVDVVPLEDGAQITFKLIRVTETLDNDVVHQQTFTVDFNENPPFNVYLPMVVKSE